MQHPFLDRLVDYAGLFPPARLAMEPALREYAGHRSSARAWMLGRFICPAGRLDELATLAVSIPVPPPLRLCVIPTPNNAAVPAVESVLTRSAAALTASPSAFEVEVIEIKLTARVPSHELAQAAQLADRPLYVEWTGPPDLDALAQARQSGASNLAAKLRCGGTEPDQFPSVEIVAEFLSGCLARNLPLKATAGLHHPVRHHRDGVMMHGFLNVFGAAILGHAGQLHQADLSAILNETDPTAFSLQDGGFRWREAHATAGQVRAARRSGIEGFGSCSFAEPLDDLDQADWFGFAPSPLRSAV